MDARCELGLSFRRSGALRRPGRRSLVVGTYMAAALLYKRAVCWGVFLCVVVSCEVCACVDRARCVGVHLFICVSRLCEGTSL